MKELEARLAQVETQLVAETKQMATKNAVEANVNVNANANPDWGAININMDVDFTDEGLQNLEFDIMNGNLGAGSSVPIGDFFSQEVISLGLQEPLPPDSLMDDLYVQILSGGVLHVLIEQIPNIFRKISNHFTYDTQRPIFCRSEYASEP